MRKISVVLTKYSDLISNLVYMISGFEYTHASLSLDEGNDVMYSFNYRGFCIESIAKHRKRGVTRSKCYEMQISDEAHEKLSACIRDFSANRERYCYTRLGVLLSALRIPFKWEYHYFCSQFVAELLTQTGAVKLEKSPSLYLPKQLCGELARSMQLRNILLNPI